MWKESGVVSAFAGPRLPLKWSVEIGPGYSGPTVAKGRVYITDRLTEPKQVERVHCFDADSGQAVWSYTYDCAYEGVGYEAGPRAAVTVQDGRAFALGSMGYLHVFDAATGELLWNSRLNERFQIDMPIWGIAAAPLVYGQLVILHIGGKDGACVVALDVATGEEVWRALNDRGSYSAPIITQQAGQDVLVVWTGDHVAGLDPQTGQVHWQSPMPPKNMVIGIATPVVDQGQVFVTSFYDGAKMVSLASNELTATEAWRFRGQDEQHTVALHSIIATPMLRDGYIYGVDSYGELRCLNAATGERIWEDKRATPPDRWSNIHMVQNGETTWMFNELGELIIARLSPAGFQEISRAKLIDPTTEQLTRRGRGVCWAHPAYANRCVFARNDQQLVCASLAAEQ
jgi:outer membrane protein assembly factor BamB